MSVTEAEAVSDSIDVTPHPRPLSVLGDIDFASWQCLAELVDNSFDDFLARPGAVEPIVTIQLPGKSSTPRNGQVWIKDNGGGMDLDRLNSALRAGWTGNSRQGQLGLFGMGFNIATARLGHVTKIRTTRAGDPEWVTVTLDLRRLQRGYGYRVPVVREPKDDPNEHGTEIVVSDLKDGQHEYLSRQSAKLRETLGDVYSYLLRERGFRLVVGSTTVQPRRPCLWDESRAVVRSVGRVPAVIRVNEVLPDRAVCQSCGRWQDPVNVECDACDDGALEVRERRVHGWLGVQRYIDRRDYGIDFVRNGRKILVRDLRLFGWSNPDEPGDRSEQEYPVEVPAEGRLVGEIHCDHVGVNYMKNAFEYETPEWKAVVKTIRGDGPLFPKHAKAAGYPTNRSPLARLFNGYRRNDPGLNYLVPGNGSRAIHNKAREWGELFRKGDPDYQTDEKWYDSAAAHDEERRRPVPELPPIPAQADDGPVGVLARLGLGDVAGDPRPPEPLVVAETDDARRQRLRDASVPLGDLNGRYALPDLGKLEVSVLAVRGVEVLAPGGERVPVLVEAGRGGTAEVFVDTEHPVFTEFAMNPRDLAVTELAEYFRVRGESARPLSAVIAEIKIRCLADQKVTPSSLASDAVRILGRARDAMLPVVAGASEGFWEATAPDERVSAERRFAAEGAAQDWADARETGSWVHYVPPSALSRLVRLRPESFLDGTAFRASYSAFEDAHARELALSPLLGYLGDAALLTEHHNHRGAEELARARLSLLLLEQEIVAAEESDSDR